MESIKALHVAVGSKNPAKISAVKLGCETLFPDLACTYQSIEVDSGVAVQPFGLETTLQGAINRAKNAFSAIIPMDKRYCIGVGIEAGMIPVPLTKTGYLDYQFCAVYQPDGSVSIGSGPAFEYPMHIVKMLLNDPSHTEIGSIIAQLSGIPNAKEKEGAIGYLSKNTLHRAEILQYSVIMALLPLKSPDIYSG